MDRKAGLLFPVSTLRNPNTASLMITFPANRKPTTSWLRTRSGSPGDAELFFGSTNAVASKICVQPEMFARRISGRKLRDPQRSARSGEKSAGQ